MHTDKACNLTRYYLQLSPFFQWYAIILTPIAFTILCIFVLAMWPVAPKAPKKRDADESTPLNGGNKSQVIESGDVAGDYSEDWCDAQFFFKKCARVRVCALSRVGVGVHN